MAKIIIIFLLCVASVFIVHSADVPKVIPHQSSYYVTTGSSITLMCSVSSSLPLIMVKWHRNVNEFITTIDYNTNTNKYRGSTTSRPSLTIINAAQSDAGTYICYASNSAGTGSGIPITLSVTGNTPPTRTGWKHYSNW